VKKSVLLLREYVAKIMVFLSSDLAVYSGSMSFISVFTFIPFMMLGIFAAVNVSFFAELFNLFRSFLYANLFEGSADAIVYYVNVFLQNSSKLGYLGLVFALYSVFVFIKQLDYCIHRLAGIENASFGIKRFLKYFAAIGFVVLSVSLSAAAEMFGTVLGFELMALLASIVQMWLSLFLLFFLISPISHGAKRAAFYSFMFAVLFSIFKKLFVYYILYGGSYDTIYGPFAALFWFFVWLNLSWYIFFISFKLYVK
jgi:membrane protein